MRRKTTLISCEEFKQKIKSTALPYEEVETKRNQLAVYVEANNGQKGFISYRDDELIKEVMVTSTEVSEVLMRNSNTSAVLHDLVDLQKSEMKYASLIKTSINDENKQPAG